MKGCPLLLALVVMGGCCNYPQQYSADSTTKSAKAILASPTSGEAYLGGSMARFSLAGPIKCPPSPELLMAPVAPLDENGIVHFGAFVVRHGDSNETATAYWWSNKGELRKYRISAQAGSQISFIWINERTIRFDLGQGSKTVRLNEDDGPPITELRPLNVR